MRFRAFKCPDCGAEVTDTNVINKKLYGWCTSCDEEVSSEEKEK